MALLNIWSLGHFVQWAFIGRYITRNWWLFLLLSIGWEILELYLPYEFAQETLDNKVSDVIVNVIGFGLGLRIRCDTVKL